MARPRHASTPTASSSRPLPRRLAPARARASLAFLGVAWAIAGCAGDPALRAAERGDESALRGELAAHQRRGDLTEADGSALARTVAEREIRAARGADGVARIEELHTCAAELDGALADRMETLDAIGAEAALARLDAGGLDASDVRGHARDADDAWRAVGVRGLTRTEDRPLRLAALRDPAPRVRRSAVVATTDARDARDVAPLAEVARLDPEGIVRTDAVRALSALAEGDDDVTRASAPAVAAVLRDLWTTGDDALREDLATTWATPSLLALGGRDALGVLVATEHGPGALTAAWAVTRLGGGDGAGDAALAASGGALLARALDRGSRRERMYALTVAPLADPAVYAAVKKLARADDDAEAKVVALSRLLERPADRADAVRGLEAFAARPELGRLATRASAALAGAGDRRVQAWIERDLASPDAAARLTAASSLGALGRSARAAPLLADPDPSVRTRAACTILQAARHHA